MPPPEILQVIEGFRLPERLDHVEVTAINKSIAKGVLLFEDLAPAILEKQTLKGETYREVSSTGYSAIRNPVLWTRSRRRVYHVGRATHHLLKYLACCEEIGETPRTDFYTVDLDAHPFATCDCPNWYETKRWCKHSLGLAFRLARPHRHRVSGLVVWGET